MTKRIAIAGLLIVLCAAWIIRSSISGSTQQRALARARQAVHLATVEQSFDKLALVKIDYPLPGSVFPPEIVPPTLLWHDLSDQASSWLIQVELAGMDKHLYALCDGRRPEPSIDPDAVSPNNAWKEDEYQATARGWTPETRVWELIKSNSKQQAAELIIWGLTLENKVVSRGSISLTTSQDPVGAPIFYRDVPLMPAKTQDGKVQPLVPEALPLIKWRLRDISRDSAPVVMTHMPTCGNCHSFSSDGRILSMDVDGPSGDKGAHTVQEVSEQIVIEDSEVFSWNDFDPDPTTESFGLFPRISPCGRYVAATVKDEVFVENYSDFRFLQTFYPTRGTIAIYDRETGEMASLPGADDPRYVQTNPVWTHDGRSIVFLRASARDSYPTEERATYANDPKETRIQYDLYRIPFNNGNGGKAEPFPGASRNGKSNSFPAFSPDGKWMVYVQCQNGLLMRPDSRLFIVPAGGGEAREMNCNTRLMNSWHSWSPNSRWLAFSSKSRRPFTQLFLTHIDENGSDSPAILLPGSTADNRAVNLPEFVNIPHAGIQQITSPAVEYRRHFDKGKALLDSGRIKEALISLSRSVELKDNYPESLITMGFALNCAGQPGDGIPYFRRALAVDPNRAEAHQQWGNSLFIMGRTDEALEHYDKATRIDEHHALSHSMIADILMRKGNTEEALKRYELAVNADPSRAKGYGYWARALLKAGRPAEARAKLTRCLELDPDNVNALEMLGYIMSQDGPVEEAIEPLEKAISLEPGRVQAHRILASLLRRTGRSAEALEHLQVVCRITPRAPRALSAMGDTLAQLNRVTESIDYYRRALQSEPGYDPARNGLAWILATHPDPKIRNGQEALKHAELACRNTRWGNPLFMLTLAAAHAENADFDEAVSTCEKALQIARTRHNESMANRAAEHLALYSQQKTLAEAAGTP